MLKAYSLVQVKGFDPVTRTFTGIATSPVPDRLGDVIESAGVRYTNPMPLLLHHDSRRPVGEATFLKATKDGTPFRARISTLDRESGTVKERLDEAVDSLEADPPLIRGVSIGFRPLTAPTYNKATDGFIYSEIEVVELSMVAIPAHQDATIDLVKSLDLASAALGTRPEGDSSKPSGVSDTRRGATALRSDRSPMKKSIAEQISQWEGTRQAKSARLDAIMDEAAESGLTLNEAQKDEHATLAAEVKDIDEHLVRLHDSEARMKAAAVPARGDNAEHAAASRQPYQVISVKSNELPGTKLARYVMCKAEAYIDHRDVVQIAKDRYPGDADLQTVLKTAVAAGTTIDATWAGPLVQYQNFSGDFIEFLRPMTIVGRFGTNGIPSLHRVPFNIRIPRQTSGGSASWVGQGAPKPLTKFDFDTITMLWAKLAAISVLTQELVRFSTPSAEQLVRDSLAAAIVAKQDADFIDPSKAAVTNVSPASITNGITPIVASGTNAAAFRVDFSALMAGFSTADLSPDSGVFIMSATRALQLSLMLNALGQPEYPGLSMKGGNLMGFPVIVSNYVDVGSSPSTDLIIFVNASDIYLADDGQVVISVSDQASLQMDDTPTNNAATGTGQVSVSMFQTNSVAIRAERFVNWLRRRDAAVAYISNAAYTA